MKEKILKGTIFLTGAGILTRIIGFLYRIFLANALGETELGIYQLVFPVYTICFTLYASGLQTAVSQLVSNPRYKYSKKSDTDRDPLIPECIRPSFCDYIFIFGFYQYSLFIYRKNRIAFKNIGVYLSVLWCDKYDKRIFLWSPRSQSTRFDAVDRAVVSCRICIFDLHQPYLRIFMRYCRRPV